jgi:GntR family transcriptional repressor for pyruvate dehydrogenase complex
MSVCLTICLWEEVGGRVKAKSIAKAADTAGPRGPVQFRPAARVPLSQVVFEQTMAEIREGRLRPGDRLPTELELVKLFQVSRSSVREALRGLVALGIVETKAGRGAIVAAKAQVPIASLPRHADLDNLERQALLDLLEVREALETKAALLAVERATEDDIATLRRLHEAVVRDVEAGRSYFKTNAAFHRAIAEAAHNPLLAETIAQVGGQVRAYRERLMREITSMPRQDVREHGAIVQAIAARRADRAAEAVVAHLRSFAALVSQDLTRHAA